MVILVPRKVKLRRDRNRAWRRKFPLLPRIGSLVTEEAGAFSREVRCLIWLEPMERRYSPSRNRWLWRQPIVGDPSSTQ